MTNATPKQIAQEFGISAKTLRKFLRSAFPEKAPGKGGRWEIAANKSEMSKLRKSFDEWNAIERAKRAESLKSPEIAEIAEIDEIA